MGKKLYNKNILIILVIAAVFAAGAAKKSIATASENYQYYIPNSYGRFIYDDGDKSNNSGREHDIVIDASDFSNLAKNADSLAGITDELVKTAVRKTDIIDTLEEIKNNTEGEKAVGANAVKELMQVFQDGVNKICDKLAELGFTPDSNSPDDINKSIQGIYDSRYSQGYADGLEQLQPVNGKITYTYHEHTGNENSYGGCYTKEKIITRCQGNAWCVDGPYTDEYGKAYYSGTCPVCGWGLKAPGYSPGHASCTRTLDSPVIIYELNCGKTTQTIIKAEIVFE